MADPLQVPMLSRKLPAVSWPWDSKQLAPCLTMPGSTSFTGTLRGKAAVRLVLCPPRAYPPLPRGQHPASSRGTHVSVGRGAGQQAWQQGEVSRGWGGSRGASGKTGPRPTGFWAAPGAPGTALEARPERVQTRNQGSPVQKEDRLGRG